MRGRNRFISSAGAVMFGALFTVAATIATAAVPTMMSVQGKLTDPGGNPVAAGPKGFVFRIFDAASGGNSVWPGEGQTITTDAAGLWTARVGSVEALTESVFDGNERWLHIEVNGEALTSRMRLITSPYAQRVATVDGATGGTLSSLLHVNGVQQGLRIQGPAVGDANMAYASFYDGAGTPIGYVGDGSEYNQDLYLASYIGDIRLYTPAGEALIADANGAVGIGTEPSPDDELFVQTDLLTAVRGYSTALDGVGVIGVADAGPSPYGVWGYSPSGQAGHFNGNVNIFGTLSKSAGSFKIDHPLDPNNKYLYHSFVESPDMKNIYDGTVTLDSRGEAVVNLPEWFGALNKDFRYQLTCIGGFAQVYVAEEVKNNQFKIAGGKSGLKVSWQVTGIRQDAYANAHRIPVEELKTDKERGFYIHPELFSQPEEMGIEWARHPEMMKQMKKQREKAAAESPK